MIDSDNGSTAVAPHPAGLRRPAADGSLSTSAPQDSFCAAWLDLQCGGIGGVRRGIVVLGEPDVGPFVPAAYWPDDASLGEALAEAAEEALRERACVARNVDATAVVAVPFEVDGHLRGLAAVELTVRADGQLAQVADSLRMACYGLEAMLRAHQSGQEDRTRERLIATLDMVASALNEETFISAAEALATDLAIRLDCDRVSIGFERNRHTRVIAVSHSAEFGERMNLIRAIGMAMDEARDQKSVMLYPGRPDTAMVERDHEHLARQFGGTTVLTIPFRIGGDEAPDRAIAAGGNGGAFTFERPHDRAFDADTVELCEGVVAVCSRVLDAKRRNDRGLLLRAKDAARAEAARVLGPRHFGRKLALLVIAGTIAFFSVATGNYRVGAGATLEGSVRRVLVAPYDGYVASAPRRAGDIVAAGTVLANLDDRDLKLEYFKAMSQRAQYARQYQESSAQHDRAQASIVVSQVQQAEAQINLLAEQLGRAQITAPFEGLIVSGDLTQSLGTSVKRGQVLFEITPTRDYRVILEVDETEIIHLAQGQKGNLMLASIPGEVFALKVTHLTPVTASREGRSYFRVEATLERASERLRPGMEGVAKIEVGQRKLIWIGTHKLVDWLRLTVWSWI